MAIPKRTVTPAARLLHEIDRAKSAAITAIEAGGTDGPQWPRLHLETLQRIERAHELVIASLLPNTRCSRRQSC